MPLRYIILLFIALCTMGSCKTSSKAVAKKGAKSAISEKDQIKLTRAFFNAKREKMLNNDDRAIEYLNSCLTIDENHAASYYELALLYEYAGKDAEALDAAKKAVANDGDNRWYRSVLATLYGKNGDFINSAKTSEALAKDYPQNLDYQYEWANALIHLRDFKGALEVYAQVEKQFGISEELIFNKQRLYVGMGDYASAIDELKKLMVIFPKEPRFYGMLAELYRKSGQPEMELQTLNELQKTDPENPEIHLKLASYYRDLGQVEKSFRELELAFENPSLNIDTKVKILLSYYMITERNNDLKYQAFRLTEILTQTHPDQAKSHSIYGDFLYREKKLDEAQSAYRRALELDESRYAIWSQLLLIDSELKDFEGMQTESARAMELFPSQPSFYFFNGFSNIQIKEYEKAITTLTTGKELVIENNALLTQFYANLGDAYHRTKTYNESDSAFENALRIEPNNIYVLNNYSYYLALRETNLERAEEMSKKTNELEPNSPSYADTYGWILYKMQRFSEAKEWLEKAVSYGAQNNGVILEHLGDVNFQLGNSIKAEEFWKRAKETGEGSDLLDKKITDKKLYE